jgi:4-deoxy-L-threo-5-hexosulose-uronate ketol-isomerase
MKVIHCVHPEDFINYTTAQIRERFLLENLAEHNAINCVYTLYDRMIVGLAHPVDQQLALENYPKLRANYFLERRELGIINVGGSGSVTADGTVYHLNKLDCLYIGKGVTEVLFSSDDAVSPALFYLLSAPAHARYPIAIMTHAEAVKVKLGDTATANRRTINKYIHLDGIKSCQLVIGLTILHDGSVWNTMPPHVHDRRMEAYFYFDVPEGNRVFHYMGEGQETRHILMNNYDAVVSPPWSIHAGTATASYSFIWGMAGENLDYTDMDPVLVVEMR